MERQPISSTSIASVGYDEASNTLEIQFQSGSVYQYFGVPDYVHAELVSAASAGGYFNRNIKGVYPYQQV